VNYWIELSQEEIQDLFATVMSSLETGDIPSQEFAKALQAKMIEKNRHLVEDRVIWRNEAYRWMHKSEELEQELKNVTRVV
jgi:hypothetical protein